MDGMLPNLQGYHWEMKKSSLCLMIYTSFSKSQQVMIKIATMEWFGWWGNLFYLKTLLPLVLNIRKTSLIGNTVKIDN